MQKRPLGYWETLNAVVHDKLSGHGNAACIAELEENICEDKLKQACKILFDSEPLLRSTYILDADHYALSCNAEFDNIEISLASSKADSVSLYNDFLRRPYSTDRSLWRICLLNHELEGKAWVVIGMSHVISDGFSLTGVLDRLLNFYFEEDNFEKTIDLPPSIETMIDPSYFNQERDDFFENSSSDNADTPCSWPYAEHSEIDERSTAHVFKSLNIEQLNSLTCACKQNDCSVNSLLNAALLKTLCRMTKLSMHVNLCTPINLRPFTQSPLSNSVLGCLVSMVMTEHHVDDNSNIFDLAKTYETLLHNNITQAGQYAAEFTLEQASTYVNQCKSAEKNFLMGFGITNLGKIQLKSKAASKVSSLYLSASRQAADFAGLLCVVTINSKLFIDFSFTTPSMSQNYMSTLASYFIEELNRV